MNCFRRLVRLWVLLAVVGGGLPRCVAAEPRDVETDPLVLKKLETFQDWKFGFMMHWGIYSQWGSIESWPLVEEDKWARPDDLPAWIERGKDMKRFAADYVKLNQTFHPRHFDPQPWARAAKQAGMKYVVFTTKHHDGFCLFDTRQTDYRTTHPLLPFPHRSPRRRGQGRLRDVPPRRLRHRGLLLQERLASAGLLGRRPAAPYAKPQLRHGQRAGALGDVRQLHAPHHRGTRERLRADRHPLAGWGPGPASAAGHQHAGHRDHGPQASAGADYRRSHRRRPL